MKKFTKVTAAALALITVVSAFTGCGGETASGTSSTTSTAVPEEQMGTNSGVIDAVSNVSVSEEYKNIKVDTKPIWMAWWEVQEASPAVEMFKNLYGTPEKKPEGFEDVPDENVFCNIFISKYEERYVDLAKYVTSDDSPDCFPFEIGYYPYGVYQNLFQSVDDLIDFSTDDWADYKEVIDMFEWGGKNYCPVMDLSTNSLLWYRKSVIEEAGFEDPWELFEEGEWTWETFLEMCRDFTDADNGVYAIDGYNVAENLVATTGTPFVALKDGKLVSNLYDANIEKAMDLVVKFDDSQEGLKYPKEVENNWNPNRQNWIDGKTLFFEDGTWRYQETWKNYTIDKELANGNVVPKKFDASEVCFVPFPKMDGSDEYYQAMKQDSILLCAGAKNKEGYKAWIYANLLASKDPAIDAASREQLKENYNWTDDHLDKLDFLTDADTFSPVFDFKNGLGPDIANTNSSDTVIEQLTKYPFNNGDSYTSVREANQGQINTRIDEMNAKVN